MRTPQVPVSTTPRKDKQVAPAPVEPVRSAPQVLDLRQLKQVAGGVLPGKGW